MESYKDLGSKYLHTNKKRSIITMIGCFIVSAVLFMFLNSMVCWVEKCRIDAREDDDWEILVLTDDKDTIEKIVNEDFVKSAYLGKAYSYFNDAYIEENPVYANALHINVKQKLLINYYSKYIQTTYGTEVELNDLLSWTYCQDNEGVGYLMILSGLLIAFIMAIIGVGVLRNNISISAIERVKDYGNLRCIGATKKQIKAIVYRESFFLETVGMAAGIVAGFLLSIPICLEEKRQYPIGFHIIPIILLAIAFYGDMYFAVDDGLKKVLKVSPAEAVRGNYRIKAKGIKRRHSGIWGLIFGIEGDYAYKNIKRNNGRFIRTVTALIFGMIIVVVGGGMIGQFYDFKSKMNDLYGYYQQDIVGTTNRVYSYEEQRMDLYSPEALKTISSAKGIEGPKLMYQETVYTAEDQWLLKHMNAEYRDNTYETNIYGIGDQVYTDEDKRFWAEIDEETGKSPLENWKENHPEYGEDATPWDVQAEKQAEDKAARKAYRDFGNGLVDYESKEVLDPKNYEIDLTEYGNLMGCEFEVDAYDDEDYARFEDYLIDGTLDLSENGVILINQAEITPEDSFEANTLFSDMKTFTLLDVKVGDEITIVDPAELYRLVQDELDNAKAYDEEIHEKAAEWNREHKDEKDENGDPVKNPYEEYSDIIGNNRKQAWIINSAREKLVDEGKCKTYVIEGIVSRNPNAGKYYPTLVVPQDKFFEMTGRTESDYIGMCFHVSNVFSSDLQKTEFMNAINEKQSYYYDGIEENGPTYNSYTSVFLDGISLLVEAVKTIIGVMAVLAILVIISLLNTVNVTISSLQTRRNEFAQLRSIGMTKKSLLKAVLLEGGIVWIVSTILGIVIGILVEFALYKSLIVLIIDADMIIVWPVIILTSILSLLVLCGSNYIIFKQMKLNVAEELTRSGE